MSWRVPDLGKRKPQLTVTTVLLCTLVRGVLDLDRDSSSDLAPLDDVLDLVIDLERRAGVKGKA